LVRLQHAHGGDALDRARARIGGEFLIAEDGEALFKAELEPVAAGDAVSGPVVKILMRDHPFDRGVIGVGADRPRVERVDVELLQTLLDNGIIPVLPPLGFDGDGKTYRVNSDSIAVATGEALKAAKLMFITTQDGLIVGDKVIRQMPVNDLESVLALQKSDVHPEIFSKATHALAACKAGLPRVHVLNGNVEEGLLAEVFTNEGVGTLIYGNEFQQIRRALKKDVRTIMNLTKTSVESEELVKRTRPMIEKQLADYYMFEIDKNPVACAALHVYPEEKKGELACLYVSGAHENQGIGRKLVQFVENKSRELGLHELYCLSTQAFTYFQSKGGFIEGTPDDLPPSRREKYDQSGRKSKVLVKRLK
jgi:amino-acid N-acetyltransferase